MSVPNNLESISAKVHEQWMENKRKSGVASRKSENGEELMVPYEQLSEAAKELDRGSVRAVLATAPPEQASERIEQLEVQLAGCMTAATGWAKDSPKQGDYGWSPAFQDVLDLRNKYDALLRARTGWTEDQSQPASAGALSGPDGYAFRYPDGIRFTNGEPVNGSRPLDSIPYYFESSLAAHDQKVRAEAFAEAANHKYSHGRNGAQCSCGLQFEGRADTGWPEHIRSLAAPAASKPEAGKTEP